MVKVNTDSEKIQGVLTRGVTKTIVAESLEKKLKSGKVLRIKHGVDPTTADLHLGYVVLYKKLRALQEMGHKIVFLIGDFTGRFGDPTDKLEGPRKMREKKQVQSLAKNYLKQIGKILDLKKVEVAYNGQWYDKMKAEDLLKLMSNFTAAQMLERQMFKERAEKGLEVGLHELVYPVLQGYDSVMLESDLTVIGSDQEFNELAGRRAQEIFGQAPQDLLIMPLLKGTDGEKKMSQSLGNYIAIDEEADSKYGKIMSIPDKLIEDYFVLLTDLPLDEIEEIKNNIAHGKVNPRDIKMKLAYEIVKSFDGEKKAWEAQDNFIKLFQKKEIPESIPEIKAREGELLLDVLIKEDIVSSKSEFRRLLEAGAIDVDGQVINDVNYKLGDGATVKVGKKKFIKIVI